MVAASWAEKQNLHESLEFLHKHGVGAMRAAVIHSPYGGGTIALVNCPPTG